MPDSVLNVAEVNQFLVKNYSRVIKLYNEMVRIETSELRKGMEREA